MSSARADDEDPVPPGYSRLCQLCLAAAIAIAFGDQAVQFIY